MNEVYDGAGTYDVTVSSNGETTTDGVDVDDPDAAITHVTVRDDRTSIGRIALVLVLRATKVVPP